MNEITDLMKELKMEDITTSNVVQLKAMCKKYNLKVSGVKKDLQDRLIDVIKTAQPVQTSDNSQHTRTTKREVAEEKKMKMVSASLSKKEMITSIIRNSTPRKILKKNMYGNYVDDDTSFVFSDDKMVIGKQNPKNGSIDKLTKEDIDKCNSLRYQFIIPTNLNTLRTTLLEEEEEEEEIDVNTDIKDDEVEDLSTEYEEDDEEED